MKWPVVKLGVVADVESGFGFPRDYQGDNTNLIPFFKVGDMNLPENSREMTQWTNTVSANILKSLKARAFPAGTVIFPKIGAAIATGKKRILTCDATFDNNVMGLVPTQIVAPRFLYYWSLTFDFTTISNIGPVPSVRKTTVESLEFPLPPLSEQRRIVEILDQADALRKKRAKADAKADRILDALFVKIFGDPATNPKGWQKGQLSSVINETQYGTSARANTEGKGTVVVRMNNIDFLGHLDLQDLKHIVLDAQEVERYRLEPGDLLFNRTNSRELVGKTGLWRGEIQAVPASYLIRVRVNRKLVFPEYIWAYMNTAFIKQVLFEKARRAIGMANINAQELRALPVVIPDFEIQGAFTRLLPDVGCLVEARSRIKERLDQLFQTVLHRAFTGELTATWREVHMKELLAEMKEQAKYLAAHGVHNQRENAALQESLF